jgi:hypothetical protein
MAIRREVDVPQCCGLSVEDIYRGQFLIVAGTASVNDSAFFDDSHSSISGFLCVEVRGM